MVGTAGAAGTGEAVGACALVDAAAVVAVAGAHSSSTGPQFSLSFHNRDPMSLAECDACDGQTRHGSCLRVELLGVGIESTFGCWVQGSTLESFREP